MTVDLVKLLQAVSRLEGEASKKLAAELQTGNGIEVLTSWQRSSAPMLGETVSAKAKMGAEFGNVFTSVKRVMSDLEKRGNAFVFSAGLKSHDANYLAFSDSPNEEGVFSVLKIAALS